MITAQWLTGAVTTIENLEFALVFYGGFHQCDAVVLL